MSMKMNAPEIDERTQNALNDVHAIFANLYTTPKCDEMFHSMAAAHAIAWEDADIEYYLDLWSEDNRHREGAKSAIAGAFLMTSRMSDTESLTDIANRYEMTYYLNSETVLGNLWIGAWNEPASYHAMRR